jgi:hypothetical protein
MRDLPIFLFAAVLLLLLPSCYSFNIVSIESPPYICTEEVPCPPAFNALRESTSESGSDCLFGGTKTVDGVCLHGYLIDLLRVISSRQNANVSFKLWLTTSTVTRGYSRIVKEIFQPGSTHTPLCGNKPCDLALGDITMNWARMQLAGSRFTEPFMVVGFQVLGRTVKKYKDISFAFLEPFTTNLWIIILVNLSFVTFAVLFVEFSNFRARFGYFKAKPIQESWEAQSLYRCELDNVMFR